MISWYLGDRVPLEGEDMTQTPDSLPPLGNEETETSVVLIQQSWRATLKEQGQTRGGGLSLLKTTTHQ